MEEAAGGSRRQQKEEGEKALKLKWNRVRVRVRG